MIRRLRWKIVAINMAMVTAVMLAVFVGVLVSSRAAVERTVNQRLMQVVQTGRYDASLPGEGSAAPCFVADVYPSGTVRLSGSSYYRLDDQDAIAVEAACTNVPALFLDVSDQTPINSIIFSHEDGTRLGVEHLVALGHQQIALLAGPLSSVSARLRLAGWHKYLTRNQIQPIAEREGDWSAMSGFQQTMQMLNEGIVPTAMLVANDQMALGAMRAITESGLRVGADISVVGYDDTEDSSCYIPPLTTIKQDFRLLGQTSVDRLLQLSQGQAVKGNQLLPVSLVKRKTTLAPNTQTASPRALADSLMQLARQVSRLESGQ